MSDADSPGQALRTSWLFRAAWIALWLVLAGALALAARHVDWPVVWDTLRRAEPGWVALAVAVNFSALPLWALSVRCFIPPGEPNRFIPVMSVLAVTWAGLQTFSVLGGAAAASVLFVRRAGLSVGAMLCVITLEQITTGFAKVILIGAAILLAPAPTAFKAAGLSLLLVIVSAFAVFTWAAHSGAFLGRIARRAPVWLGRWIDMFAGWTAHLDTLRRPLRFASGLAFMLSRRLTEAFAAVCIQKATGIPVSFELALLITAAIALATIIPGPPGNIGYYEAVVVLAYGWGSVGRETAVAAALLQHIAFLVAAMAPGYLLLALRRRSLLERAR